jgi:hypothetical protein
MMSHVFTVELSDAEKKALEYVSLTANEWIQNAVHERCRLAIEEMVQEEIKRKMEAGEPISGTKEEIVMASTLPSAQHRHEAAMAQANLGPMPGL